MDIRDELRQIRERAATARVRATEDEADLARRPTRLMSQSQFDRRLLARDNVRLLKALEAVCGLIDEAFESTGLQRDRAYFRVDPREARDAITEALEQP